MSTPIRVRCRLENASNNISGIRFGRIEGGSETLVISEPVDPEQVAALLTIPGFERADIAGDIADAVDAAIAASLAADQAAADTASPLIQTNEELLRANAAIAAELQTTRDQLEAARRASDPAVLAQRDADITRLRDALAPLQAELEKQGAEVTRLGGELQTATARAAQLEQEQAGLTEKVSASTTDLATARSRVTEVETANDRLTKELEASATELTAARARVAELEQTNAGLAEQLSKASGPSAGGGGDGEAGRGRSAASKTK